MISMTTWRARVGLSLEGLRRWLRDRLGARPFPGSRRYWDQRYASGGTSGAGSSGKLAEFKAEVLNAFVRDNRVHSVIEHGCGDGNQLRLAAYPSYLGFDVSADAVALCRRLFAGDCSKSFRLASEYRGERADLALSLDVVFHLVEDEVFEAYMKRLFASAERFVVVYSSDTDEWAEAVAAHVRHRRFTRWVEENAREWTLRARIPNRYPFRSEDPQGSSFADFFVYERRVT